MKLSLCLVLSAALMVLAGCQGEPDRPADASAPAPAVTMNAAKPTDEPSPPVVGEERLPAEAEPPAPAAGDSSGLTKEFLTHQKFVLVQVNEADYVAEQDLPTPTLEFGDDFRVSGRICNNFNGPGELQNDVLSVRAVASTRMLCPDSNLTQLETRFFQMLESGVTLSMDGDRLHLRQGESSLVFKAQTGS